MLVHSPQGNADACLYHAAYALTHDPVWLDWAAAAPETCACDLTFMQRLGSHGLLLFAHHSAQRVTGQPVGEAFWSWLREHFAAVEDSPTPLLVTIWGHRLYHCVAVALPPPGEDRVVVSDSAQPGHLFLTWEEFLTSRYAQAYRVEMLVPLHPPDP